MKKFFPQDIMYMGAFLLYYNILHNKDIQLCK